MALDLGSLVLNVLANADDAIKDIDLLANTSEKASNKSIAAWNKVGGALTSLGTTITKAVGVPIAGLGAAAVKVGMDFEQAMAKVSAISGATGKDLQDLEDKARLIGSTTQFSAAEAAEGLSYMAMAGWKTEQMLAGLDGIVNLAIASEADLAIVSDIVTDALTAFGLTADDTNTFVDVLAAAATNANTNVEMLGESFKYVAPVAGALGYSAEDTAVALGLMANAGIKGSQAGTALRAIMANLAAPTDTVVGAMDRLNLSLTDGEGNMKSLDTIMQELRVGFKDMTEDEKAATAAHLAGKEGMSGLLAVVNASEEDFEKLSLAINNSEDACKGMAETMQNTAKGSIKAIRSSLEDIGITIYKTLQPSIETILGKIKDFTSSLAENLRGNDELVKKLIKVAGLAIAVGPSIMAIGTAMSAVASITGLVNAALGALGFAATVSCGVVAAALGALVGIVAGVVNNVGGSLDIIKNSFYGFQGVMDEAKIKWDYIWVEMSRILTDVYNTVIVPLFTAIGAIIGIVVNIFKTLWPKISDTYVMVMEAIRIGWDNVLKPLFDTIMQVVLFVVDTFRIYWPHIASIIDQVWTMVKELWLNVLKPIFDKITSVVKDVIYPAFQEVWPSIQNLLSNVFNTIVAIGNNVLIPIFRAITEFIKNVVKPAFDFVWPAIQGLFEGVCGVISGLIKGVVDMLNTFVDMVKWVVKAISAPLNAIKDAFSSAFGWIGDFIGNVSNKVSGFLDKINIFRSAAPQGETAAEPAPAPRRVRRSLMMFAVPDAASSLQGLSDTANTGLATNTRNNIGSLSRVGTSMTSILRNGLVTANQVSQINNISRSAKDTSRDSEDSKKKSDVFILKNYLDSNEISEYTYRKVGNKLALSAKRGR